MDQSRIDMEHPQRHRRRRGDPNPLDEGRWYDTAPDGRFLMPCGTTHQEPSITVTVDWATQLANKGK